MALVGIGDKVEGLHAVAAAVAAGRVTTLHVEFRRMDDTDVEALVTTARDAGVSIEMHDDVRPLAITTAPQGVVAEARPIRLTSLEEMASGDRPAIIVLDHLEDPRNVGAVARSALAAGVKSLVVPERRAAPLGATAFKAAAGTLEKLQLAVVSSVADAVARFKKLDVWTVGLDGSGKQSIFGLDLLTEPVALVVGGEGRGLGRLVADRVDVLAHIPISDEVESLNASVAAALAMFELARVRGWVT